MRLRWQAVSETLSAIVSSQRRVRGLPALHVGLAADEPSAPAARVSLAKVDRVEIGRGERRRVHRITHDGAEVLELTLADARLSSQHARITRLGRDWVLEDLSSKNGTWVNGKRVARQPLESGDAIFVGHTMLLFRDTGGDEPDLDAPVAAASGFATMAPALAARFAELGTAARSTVPVEITGETGTGKDLAARAVHQHSGRSGAFIAVNCGAIASTLLEAELFGHRKGAYTGATEDRVGLVRSADGGTLFLDEVAELPSASQVALLRVLQTGELVPVGADRPVRVDVRVVTATHKRLDDEVEANRFRADLRARLLGIQLELPPLRERAEDLALLVTALLARVASGRALTFSADAVMALYAYPWPLNIRELERALAAAAAVAKERIELHHLPAALRARVEMPVEVEALSELDHALRDQLAAAMARHGGNLAAVARELGKDRTQIRRWMKRFGLDREP